MDRNPFGVSIEQIDQNTQRLKVFLKDDPSVHMYATVIELAHGPKAGERLIRVQCAGEYRNTFQKIIDMMLGTLHASGEVEKIEDIRALEVSDPLKYTAPEWQKKQGDK